MRAVFKEWWEDSYATKPAELKRLQMSHVTLIILKIIFFTQHSYFPCLYLVIQWYLLCASLTRTLSLSHSHSEKQPGLLSQWYHSPHCVLVSQGSFYIQCHFL